MIIYINATVKCFYTCIFSLKIEGDVIIIGGFLAYANTAITDITKIVRNKFIVLIKFVFRIKPNMLSFYYISMIAFIPKKSTSPLSSNTIHSKGICVIS